MRLRPPPVPEDGAVDGTLSPMHSHIAPENDTRGLRPATDATAVDVTVVIPVYNRVGLLRRTVAALVAQDHPADRLQVVVADDGSEEDVPGALADLQDRLDLRIQRREHAGYGAGQARNLGASVARGDVLVFVDADCVPDPSLVSRHARWHTEVDNLVVIGARHGVDTSTLEVADLADGSVDLRARVAGPRRAPGEELGPSDWRGLLYRRTARLRRGDEAFRSLVSSNFSVRRETFLSVGGFDPAFTRWGGEDTELGWRLFVDGCFFLPDDDAIVFHQLQEDAGAEGWREESRHRNDGIIRSKIPHRFYRHGRFPFQYEVPKVSLVVGPVDGDRARAVFTDLQRQNLSDWRAVFVGSGPELTSFAEEGAADPRVTVVSVPDAAGDDAVHRALVEAADDATGEYVAFLHGAVTADHRLLARAVRRLDQRPRSATLSTGYRLPGEGRVAQVRTTADVAVVDEAWRDGLPVFGMLRRREWRKHRRSHPTDGLTPWAVLGEAGREHLGEPLVGVPGWRPVDAVVAPSFRSPRSILLDDLRSARSPRGLAVAATRFAQERAGRGDRAAPQLRRTVTASEESSPSPPRARYVGWAGHDNLGDEALYDAISGLLPFAQLHTSGPPTDLLLLGGGTLINRGYLAQLDRMDSPRIERAVLGTGVANPEYWGTPRENPADWVEFLSTCGYVGVRGPTSADLLREWGHRGQLEIVGDPALAISRPDVDRVDGRVVVNLARTRGELWGGDDDHVVDAVADLVGALCAEGRDVHVLSCFPGDDGFGIEMMRRAGTPELPYVFGYRSTPDALELLASASLVVGERLHSLVLAAACRTPFVGLEYRPKVRDFARSVDADHWVLRTDQVDGPALRARVAELDGRRDDVVEEQSAHVDEYRRRLQAAADQIRELC